MDENRVARKIEGANLPQFFTDIFNKVNTKIKALLEHAAEDENTAEYQHVYMLLDSVLKNISAIQEQNLNNLNQEELFELDGQADEAIKEFEKVYGNKTDKATTKPN